MTISRTGISPQELSDNRLKLLLKVATEEFLEKGYSRTSIAGISLKSGVSKNTIYKHFSGKEALFEAVHKGVETSTDASLLDLSKPVESLHAFAKKYRQTMHKPVALELSRSMIAEYPHMKSTVTRLHKNTAQGQLAPLADFFRELAAKNRMIENDPEEAARHFNILAMGGFKLFFEPKESASAEEKRLRSDIDFFIRGYGIRNES